MARVGRGIVVAAAGNAHVVAVGELANGEGGERELLGFFIAAGTRLIRRRSSTASITLTVSFPLTSAATITASITFPITITS